MTPAVEQGEPRRLVADTGAAVKWHPNEKLSGEAVRLLDSVGSAVSGLLAPGTILPEFFNAFWQRCRRGDLSLDEVRQAWADFSSGQPATLYAVGDLTPRRVAEITQETGVVVYGALFLALAGDSDTFSS